MSTNQPTNGNPNGSRRPSQGQSRPAQGQNRPSQGQSRPASANGQRPPQRSVPGNGQRPPQGSRPNPNAPQRPVGSRSSMQARRRKKNNNAWLIGGIAAAAVVVVVLLVVILSTNARNRKYDNFYENATISYSAQAYDQAMEYAKLALEVKGIRAPQKEAAYLLMADVYVAKGDVKAAQDLILQAYMELRTETLQQRLTELQALAGGDEASGESIRIGSVTVKSNAKSAVLSAMDLDSTAIAELEKITTLETLTLSQNRLTDISVLAKLKELSYLQLADNQISDLNPLKELTKLQTLYLDNNPITDFKALYSLKSLTLLSLNGIEMDTATLEELKTALPGCEILNEQEAPTEIELGGKKFSVETTEISAIGLGVEDLSDLSFCTKLETLDLQGNSVRSINALSGLTTLKKIILLDNQVAGIAALGGLTALEYLDLGGNPVNDLTALSSLSALKELRLDNTDPMTLSPLTNLTALERLSLKNCSLKDADLEYLKNLRNLKYLNIEGSTELTGAAIEALIQALPDDCQVLSPDVDYSVKWGGVTYKSDVTLINAPDCGITDISILRHFKKLEFLDLSNNDISDASALSELTTLKELFLAGNKLDTVSALQKLTNLTYLDVSDNEGISWMRYLQGLKNLTYLDISDNEDIEDVKELYGLTNLRTLDVSGTALSWEQVKELREKLPGCNVICDVEQAEPSATPSPTPTATPTQAPTQTAAPTPAPTQAPTEAPTEAPQPTPVSPGNIPEPTQAPEKDSEGNIVPAA